MVEAHTAERETQRTMVDKWRPAGTVILSCILSSVLSCISITIYAREEPTIAPVSQLGERITIFRRRGAPTSRTAARAASIGVIPASLLAQFVAHRNARQAWPRSAQSTT